MPVASDRETGPSMKPLIAISIYNTIYMAAAGLSYPGTPLYLATKGLEGNFINAVLSLVAIIGLLGTLFFGYLSDRLLSKLAFVEIGTIASVAGYVALAVLSDPASFALTYILAAFVGSAAGPAIMALLIDTTSFDRRGRSMGIFWSAASIGWASAVAFAGWIIDNLGGSFLYVACAALQLGSLLVVHFGLKQYATQEGKQSSLTIDKSSLPSTSSHLGISFFVLFFGTMAFFVLDYAKNVYVPMFYAFELKLGATTATLLLSLTSWIEVPSNILLGALSDKVGRKKIVMLSYVLGSLYIILNAFVTNMLGAAVAMAMYALVWGSFISASYAFASELIARENRGFGMGLFNSTGALGSILAPLTIGTLAQSATYGYRFAFMVMSATMMLACIFFMIGIREKPIYRSSSEPHAGM